MIERKDVFVGIVQKGTIHVDCVKGLMNAGLMKQVHFSNSYFIDDSRDELVREFLETDCKYLLWVDTDNILPLNIMSLFDVDEPLLAPLNWFGVLRHDGMTVVYPGLMQYTPIGRTGKESPYSCYMPPAMTDGSGNRYTYCHNPNGGVWAARRDVWEEMKDDDGCWFRVTWKDEFGIMRHSEDGYFFRRLNAKERRPFVIDLSISVGHLKMCDLRPVGESFTKYTGVKNNDGILKRTT